MHSASSMMGTSAVAAGFNRVHIALLRATFIGVAAGLLALSGAERAFAQEYPSKPIRLVVPFPVGGAPDVLARSTGAKLGERLGQPVVIENRLGAGGNLAYEMVAKAAPDGYTMVLASTGVATNVSLYKNLPYDAVRDFAPITLVASSPHVLVAHPSVQASSVRELMGLAKEKSSQLNYGSAGSGTVLHLAGEMFNVMAGAHLLHVPYKGASLALTDLLGGRVTLMFSDIPNALPQIKAGKLRALGVTGAQRSQALPQVPTIAEAGIPGYAIIAWFGLLAPAATPAGIVARLNKEVVAVLGDPGLRAKMADLGQDLVGDTPEQFGAFIKSEIAKMGEVVKASGAKPN